MGGWDSWKEAEQVVSGFKETEWKEVTGSKAVVKSLEDIELDPAQEILRKFIQECLYNKNFEWRQVEFRILMWTAFDLGREYEKAKGGQRWDIKR